MTAGSAAARRKTTPPKLLAPSERQQGKADIARLLTLAERTITARLSTVLTAEGATVDEWRVLWLLGDHRWHTMTEIAEFTMMHPPTLTKLVDRMIAADLVCRRTDDNDRRRVLVLISDRGRQVLARLSNLARNEQVALAALFGLEDVARLEALLVRICARLNLSVKVALYGL